jgi:hypothetical protein
MTRSLAILLAASAFITGCAAGGGAPESRTDPRRDLAETPASLAPTHKPRGGQHSEPQPTDAVLHKPGTSKTPTIGRSTDTDGENEPPPILPFRSFAQLTDGAGDAGASAPAYADLRSVDLAANATDLRVTVTVAGTLPAQLPDEEIIGVGIDLYPVKQQAESDYQLFVDGEPDGWFAYLQTPRGLVRYPGTFALGGTRLIFVVPLKSVGSPNAGRFSAFLDWSGPGLVGPKASADRTPSGDPKPYSR